MLLNNRFQNQPPSSHAGRVVSRCVLVVATVLSSVVLLGEDATLSAQEGAKKYQTAREAYSVGAALYNKRDYAAAQEPFEAALKLAPDDAFRLKVYRALMSSYRLLPEIDKMSEAAEFIMRKSERDAERSLVRRSLLSFLYQRGKVDVAVERYEDMLKKDAKDRLALYVLSEMYAHVKREPKRAAELIERLAALDGKEGKPKDALKAAKLAQQYVRAGKFQEGAELYEEIAPLNESLAAWHWKEAAAAWLKAGDKERALKAARASDASDPEQRSQLLIHFWHRGLADAFLQVDQPKLAIPHYEKALENTDIEGYIKGCQKSLADARAQAGN